MSLPMDRNHRKGSEENPFRKPLTIQRTWHFFFFSLLFQHEWKTSQELAQDSERTFEEHCLRVYLYLGIIQEVQRRTRLEAYEPLSVQRTLEKLFCVRMYPGTGIINSIQIRLRLGSKLSKEPVKELPFLQFQSQ